MLIVSSSESDAIEPQIPRVVLHMRCLAISGLRHGLRDVSGFSPPDPDCLGIFSSFFLSQYRHDIEKKLGPQ